MSEHGGHFGPNFGMVEATIALHYVFNSPKDKIVYDVSHQSYVHKMLTGRKDAFLHPAEYDNVSGYSEPQESEHDFFVIGHTSTSVSLASGLAKGRDLTGGNENIIAVIGDGSLSGGEAFEGLDYVAGYEPAEQNKEKYHWRTPFDIVTGESKVNDDAEDYSEVTAQYLLKKMKEDKRVVTITSGTPAVLGFTPARRQEAGKQFVDVGIAEEHAVALASGIAANGGKPVYGVYSTFIQRSYDQLSQDLCINNNPAVLLVFWGTLSGMNDVTHLCFFDIPLISNIPNMVYLAPTCKEEYLAMLEWSIRQNEHPVAIRVPATEVISYGEPAESDYSNLNRYKVVHRGSKVAIVALGSFFGLGQSVLSLLKNKANIDATLINPRYITGVDSELMDELKADHELVITLEDGVLDGGFGEKIARYYGATDMKVLNYGAKKEFVDRYDVQELLRSNHLTDKQIVEDIISLVG